MNHTEIHREKGINVALLTGQQPMIASTQSALDLAMTLSYESNCNRIALEKALLHEDFFKLSTGLAGDILQRFVNYHFKLAIIGDFSSYTSKPLQDFMYESNKGTSIFFVASREEAIDRLVEAE